MHTANDIAEIFESIAPKELGLEFDELGFVYGDPETEVKGIACVWDVNAKSLADCHEKGINMIICHEHIWMLPQTSDWYQGPSETEIFSNNLRKKLLDDFGMVVYRSHSNWDALEKDGVPDQAVKALNLSGIKTYAKQKFFSVQELSAPITVAEISERCREGLAFDGIRVFGDKNKQVTKFAFLIGGFGENQFHMPQAAKEMGAEMIIIGEMNERMMIGCLEQGLPVIETLHSASEIPALKRQAELLGECVNGLPVHYIPSGARVFNT